MKKQIFIGVDGGATKSVIRMETDDGRLLGQVLSGPASIRNSITESWQSIQNGINTIIKQQQITRIEDYVLHAGFGLAGCEIKEAYHAFQTIPHPFATLMLTSDAHVACLGAHCGEDGAIIIVGTGVVGYHIQAARAEQVGGWGFPHDDMGGGAWLGMQAVNIALRCYDRRLSHCELAEKIHTYFSCDIEQLVSWANLATPRLFATLAPIVIAAAKEGDSVAITLLQQAALAIQNIYAAFTTQAFKAIPCVLVGSIAPFLVPYLDNSLQLNLRTAKLSPDQGAVLMVKQRVLSEANTEE